MSIRVNTDAPSAPLYKIRLPNNEFFADSSDYNAEAWPMHVAKRIAFSISVKRRCVTTLVKIEEPVTNESPFDHILHFVSELKGQYLRVELKAHSLPYGSDGAYSKRERLIAHLTKCKQITPHK